MSNPGQNNPDQVIMTLAEFLANAQETDLFQQVADEVEQEQKETIVVDSPARRDEEANLLANQVAGGDVTILSCQKSTPKTEIAGTGGVLVLAGSNPWADIISFGV